MADTFDTLEEATKALTNTAQRAAQLMRQESERARQEAGRAREESERAWSQIESVRSDILVTKGEIEDVRRSIFSAGSETERLRTSTRLAWGTVGVMAVLMMVAVGWTASVLTRGNAQVGTLSGKVNELQSIAEMRQAELNRLRSEAEVARIAQARAEGELHAVSYARTLAPELSRPVEFPADLPFNMAAPTKVPSLREMISSLLESDAWKIVAPEVVPANSESNPTEGSTEATRTTSVEVTSIPQQE